MYFNYVHIYNYKLQSNIEKTLFVKNMFVFNNFKKLVVLKNKTEFCVDLKSAVT